MISLKTHFDLGIQIREEAMQNKCRERSQNHPGMAEQFGWEGTLRITSFHPQGAPTPASLASNTPRDGAATISLGF